MTMNYRRLGRTDLDVSVIGVGTSQLRMVPERQAIDTLVRAFSLGINLVHTSPDYEGAEGLIAKAMAETDRKVIVCGQAYDRHNHPHDPVSHFERLFEQLCETLDQPQLDIFGIACIDNREAFQENVGPRRHGRVPATAEGERPAQSQLLHDAWRRRLHQQSDCPRRV